MIVLDAYALTAMLADEPAAEEVETLIGAVGVAIPSPNLAEATDRLGRVHGIATHRTRVVVESLEQSANLRVRTVEAHHAWRAAELRVKHYHRTKRPLSLGDCLLLASVAEGERVATSDPHVLDTAGQEDIDWTALADSRGRRHTVARRRGVSPG